MVSTVKLLKTFAYATIAICSLISFGTTSEFCQRQGGGRFCSGRNATTIAFSVFSTIVAVAMLVLHMLAEQLASKVCWISAHVLFAFIVVALGTSASASLGGLSLALLANFVAIILATLLCVYSWHTFDRAMFKKKKTESTVPEPSVTAEVPSPPVTTQV